MRLTTISNRVIIASDPNQTPKHQEEIAMRMYKPDKEGKFWPLLREARTGSVIELGTYKVVLWQSGPTGVLIWVDHDFSLLVNGERRELGQHECHEYEVGQAGIFLSRLVHDRTQDFFRLEEDGTEVPIGQYTIFDWQVGNEGPYFRHLNHSFSRLSEAGSLISLGRHADCDEWGVLGDRLVFIHNNRIRLCDQFGRETAGSHQAWVKEEGALPNSTIRRNHWALGFEIAGGEIVQIDSTGRTCNFGPHEFQDWQPTPFGPVIVRGSEFLLVRHNGKEESLGSFPGVYKWEVSPHGLIIATEDPVALVSTFSLIVLK